jgi:hypothetical protein
VFGPSSAVPRSPLEKQIYTKYLYRSIKVRRCECLTAELPRGQPDLLFVGLARSKQWQHNSSTLKTTHHKVTITATYLVSPCEMKMTTFELLAMLLHVVHQHEIIWLISCNKNTTHLPISNSEEHLLYGFLLYDLSSFIQQLWKARRSLKSESYNRWSSSQTKGKLKSNSSQVKVYTIRTKRHNDESESLPWGPLMYIEDFSIPCLMCSI